MTTETDSAVLDVRIFMGLAAYVGGRGRFVEALETGDTAGSVLARLGIPAERVGMVLINGCNGKLSSLLCAGDRVAYFPDYVPYHKVYGTCVV